MYVKKFEAADMKTALLQVKKSMGEDAVILSTRQFKKRGREYGLTGRPAVEITAAIDSDSPASNPLQGRLKSYQESQASHPPTVSQTVPGGIEQLAEIVNPLRAEIRALRQEVNKIEPPPEEEPEIKNDLEEIKGMVSTLMGRVTPVMAGKIMEEYEPYYLRLVSSGVSEKNAAELVLSLSGQKGESIPVAIARKVIEKLASGKTNAQRGLSGRVSSLVGPTGVGKTTTVAKIASELAFSGFKVGLISLDTYRIAAAEQLRIYANIIGVPVLIVESPEEFSRAVSKMEEQDFVLVDTVGRSHMDMDGIRELGSYFHNVQVSNHLVINAGMSGKEVSRVVKNFSSCMRVDNFLFTKMDETSAYGTLYNLITEWKRPVSYITTGQKVPEDIERATAERLAGFILNPASTGRFYET